MTDFKIGDYLLYEGKIKPLDKCECIMRVNKISVEPEISSKLFFIKSGHMDSTYYLESDRLLKIEDLKACVPYLPFYNEEAKEFLKNATIWCLLRVHLKS